MSQKSEEQKNYHIIKYNQLDSEKKEFSNRALIQFHSTNNIHNNVHNRRRKKQIEYQNNNLNSDSHEENKTTGSTKKDDNFYSF